MDNFDQPFDNHFHNHFDNHFDQSCYEPVDYSIDPMAFVPGAALDASKPSWGASLAIQQGIEALEASRAQAQAQAHAHTHDSEHARRHQADEHAYGQDGGQDYYEAPAQTRELPPQDVYPAYMTPTALSAPAHFYPKEDAYADRTDLTDDGKQMLRDADALLLMLSGCYGEDEKEGQKVSHKTREGLQASNLAVTPLPTKGRFGKEYLWNPKGIFQFTRDFLMGSLRFRY